MRRQTRRLFGTAARVLVTAAAFSTLSLWAAEAGGPPAAVVTPAVRARVVSMAFRDPGRAGADADGLWTTEAVILENAWLSATVVPALGGRVVRLVHRPSGRDLLAGRETAAGTVVRFPAPWSDPPEDAGVAWRLVRDPGGAVTVATDRRFTQFTGRRRGLFSPMRLGVRVTLRPGEAALEVTSRVDNPLPLRCGFRLWQRVLLPAGGERAGLAGAAAMLLLPTGAVVDVPGRARPWPGAAPVPVRLLGPSPAFALGTVGDWAGVYDPSADLAILVIRPRFTAPGVMVRSVSLPGEGADASAAEAVEVAVGSSRCWTDPGHYLQPFGAWEMTVRLTAVEGLGPVAWADGRVVVGMTVGKAATTLRLVGLEPVGPARVTVEGGGRRAEVRGVLGPDRRLEVTLSGRCPSVRLTVLDAEDDEVVDATVPPPPEPLRLARAGEASGGAGTEPPAPGSRLAAGEGAPDGVEPSRWPGTELLGWQPVRAAGLVGSGPVKMAPAGGSADPAGRPGLALALDEMAVADATVPVQRLLAASRLLLLASGPTDPRWAAVRGRLAFRAARSPHRATANGYLALMRLAEAGGRPTPLALAHAGAAERTLAGAYVAALGALAKGDMMGGLRHLGRLTEQAPPIAMGLGSRRLPDNGRLHPAALLGGHWPRLMAAAVRLEIGQGRRAAVLLEDLLREAPGRVEAVALLAEACRRLAEAEAKAPRGRSSRNGAGAGGRGPRGPDWDARAVALGAEAERMLASSPQARRDLEALWTEVRLGRWRGVPRP